MGIGYLADMGNGCQSLLSYNLEIVQNMTYRQLDRPPMYFLPKQPQSACYVMARRICIAFGIGFALSLNRAAVSQDNPAVIRAGEQFQNVTVLADMPADQMGKVMNLMSEALGVSCGHCHVGYDFVSEDAPRKAVARKMIEMTFRLNREVFAGQQSVTCWTCHRGQTHPQQGNEGAPVIATLKKREPQATDKPQNRATVDEVMSAFQRATVGVHELKTGEGKRIEAVRHELDGRQEPEQIDLVSPLVFTQTTEYGKTIIVERYRANAVEKTVDGKKLNLKPDESIQIAIEARVLSGSDLRDLFTSTLSIIDGPDERQHVLSVRQDGLEHRFWFDSQTGWMLGRTTTIPTVLGNFVLQVTYEEHRDWDGLILPQTTRFHMPGIEWRRELKAVRPAGNQK